MQKELNNMGGTDERSTLGSEFPAARPTLAHSQNLAEHSQYHTALPL
jgi:hypothetical protein